MAIQIKLKNSVVQDSTPSTSDLPAVGEIALNANINSIGGFMRASDNSIVKIFGPGSLSTPTATTTVSGISELATNTETTTGSATNRVVTPAGLNAVTVAERSTSNSTYLALAGGTLTGVVAATAGSNSAPSIHFGDSDSGIFGGTNTVSLAAGGTTRLTAGTGVSVTGTLTVSDVSTFNNNIKITDKIIHSGDENTLIRFPAADTVSVETGGSERARFDSQGRYMIGTSSTRGIGGTIDRKLHIESTDASSGISVTRNSNNTSPPFLSFGKSRGSSVSGTTVVQSGDQLGQINFSGADGTDLVSNAASISSFVDGAPGSDDMPGRLVFSTTADGAASPTERLRIDSSGRLLIGTTTEGHDNANDLTIANSGHAGISVRSGTSNNGSIFFSDGTSGADEYRGWVQYTHSTDYLTFGTNAGERLRIDSNGRLLLGNTTLGEGSADNLTITDSAHCGITIRSGSSSGGNLFFTDLTSGDQFQGFVQYDHSSNHLGFGTQKIERMRIDSSGLVNIGSGANASGLSPLLHLHKAASNATAYFHITNADTGISNTNGLLIGYNSSLDALIFNKQDTPMRFATNGAERMRIDSSGNVGIGTTSPVRNLHIKDTSPRIMLSNDNTGHASGDGTELMLDSGGNFEILQRENLNLEFFTNNLQRMTILGDGKVGIGTTSPAYNLDISNSSGEGQLRIDSSAGNHGMIRFSQGGTNKSYIQHVNGDDLAFGPGGSEKVRMDSSGNVGIGTSSPASVLELASHRNAETDKFSAANYHLHLRNTENDNGEAIGISFAITSDETAVGAAILHERDTSGSQGSLQFLTNSNGSSVTERMRIASDGKVGINIAGSDNTSPVRNLDIADSSGAILRLISSDDSLGANERVGEIEFFTDDDDAGHVSSFIKAIADPSDAFGRRGSLTFGTRSDSGNGTEKIRILHSGGITFNGDTAIANALDDYEEGTYSPTITSGFTGNAPTYLNQNGAYVKIGKQVTVWFFLRFNAFTTDGGQILVSLPIAASTGSHGYFGALSYHSIANASQAHTFNVYLKNATSVQFYAGAGYSLTATSGTSQNGKYIIGGFTYQVP